MSSNFHKVVRLDSESKSPNNSAEQTKIILRHRQSSRKLIAEKALASDRSMSWTLASIINQATHEAIDFNKPLEKKLIQGAQDSGKLSDHTYFLTESIIQALEQLTKQLDLTPGQTVDYLLNRQLSHLA
jgi:hypothetical protein